MLQAEQQFRRIIGSRDLRPIVAISDAAVVTLTPGIVISRRISGQPRA
jgi:hypothetical protein